MLAMWCSNAVVACGFETQRVCVTKSYSREIRGRRLWCEPWCAFVKVQRKRQALVAKSVWGIHDIGYITKCRFPCYPAWHLKRLILCGLVLTDRATMKTNFCNWNKSIKRGLV